jgi:hypothetical protein
MAPSRPPCPAPGPTPARDLNLITWGINNYHYRADVTRKTPSFSAHIPENISKIGIGHDITDPTKTMWGYINRLYLWNSELPPELAEPLVRGDIEVQNADEGLGDNREGALSLVINTQGTGTSGDRVFQLPVLGAANEFTVFWGDANSTNYLAGTANGTINYTYDFVGLYKVELQGLIEQLQFGPNSPTDAVRILQWGDGFRPVSMNRIFDGCVQLDFAPGARTNIPNTSAVTNWIQAFRNCNLLSGAFPLFNTAACTSFQETWQNCSSLTSFPAINSSNATSFLRTWSGCIGLSDFPAIDTGNGTTFESAWDGCINLNSFPLINTENATNLIGAWRGLNKITSFPAINTSKVTNFDLSWNGCSSLTTFPTIDTSSGVAFGSGAFGHGTWRGCSSLTSFPLLDFSSATALAGAWFGCSALTSFPAINTSTVTQFGAGNQGAWEGCSSLTSFPSIDTSSGTNFERAWMFCSALATFPALDFSNATNMRDAWNHCSSLTSFPLIDTSNVTVGLGSVTSGRGTWRNCSSLTSFPQLDLSNVTGAINGAWAGCTSLTSFPAIDLPNVTSFGSVNQGAWQSCTSLTSFPFIDVSGATGTGQGDAGFRKAWQNCTSLAAFPANMFNTVAATNFFEAFTNCALTAESIENILVSINTASTSNGVLSLNAGTNTGKAAWTTAAVTAFDALVARGWTITHNA